MYNHKNKNGNIQDLNSYMFVRSKSMFNYVGLPSSLPAGEIEKVLQETGYGVIMEHDGSLVVQNCTFEGERDIYGYYKQVRIINPHVNINKLYTIGEDCVLIKNDIKMLGLLPIYNKYNSLIVENDISIVMNMFNSRIQNVFSSDDSKTVESANVFINKIEAGELGVVTDDSLFKELKVNNASLSHNITNNLIEQAQYLRATLFNEIGLNANFNMKRERLNTSEVDMNTEFLHTLVDEMLDQRNIMCEDLQNVFGLDVEVEFGSIWNSRTSEKISKHFDPEPEDIDQEEVDPEAGESIVDREGNIITDEMILKELYEREG